MFQKIIAITCSLAFVGACASPAKVEAINFRYIHDIQLDLKRQVGMYVAITKNEPAKRGHCFNGAPVDFEVTAIKLELLTTKDEKIGGKLAVEIPLFTGASISPSLGSNQEVENVQQLQFTEWALPTKDQKVPAVPRASFKLEEAQITSALLDIRDSMTAANIPEYKEVPLACLASTLPSKNDKGLWLAASDSGNKFVFGVTITRLASSGIGLALAPITLSVSDERTVKHQSTLTVWFAQVGQNPISECLKVPGCPINIMGLPDQPVDR